MPVVVVLIVALALLAPRMNLGELPILFAAIALFTGSAMPVVQTTVQFVAGPKQLGAAAGLGAVFPLDRGRGRHGIVGAVLFANLAAADPGAATLFGAIIETGPRALAGLQWIGSRSCRTK